MKSLLENKGTYSIYNNIIQYQFLLLKGQINQYVYKITLNNQIRKNVGSTFFFNFQLQTKPNLISAIR